MRRFLIPTLAILAISAAPCRSTAGLIAFYQFNDPQNLGLDQSGLGNDATNFGATYAAAGHGGGAASLDGVSYLRSPVDVSVSARPRLTWGAWVKPTAPNPIRAVLSADNGDSDRTINIDFRGGSVSWSVFVGNGVVASGVAPSTTEWAFLAASYDQAAGAMTFYVNDLSFTTTTVFGPSQSFFDIGHNPSYGEFFAGLVDDVFVYDEILSAAEIEDIRVNGISAVPEPSTLTTAGLAVVGGVGVMLRRRSRKQA